MTETKIFSQEEMKEIQVLPFASGEAVIFSTRCPGESRPNEDAAGLIPFNTHSGVLAVADGVGGKPSGEQAAAMAIEALKEELGTAEKNGVALREAILNAFEKANKDIISLGTGAATTLTVVEITNQTIRFYNVGDSGAAVFGQRGKLKLQTLSHSPVGYALESGILSDEDAIHHDDRHLVSNLVGFPDMHIEVGSHMRLSTRDTIFVASDGLLDNLHPEEIIEILRHGPLKKKTQQLRNVCQERMNGQETEHPSKPDDLTFIVFRPLKTNRKTVK